MVTDGLIVNAMFLQPCQQGYFRWIAYSSTIFPQLCRRIEGDSLSQRIAFRHISNDRRAGHLNDRHLVFRQGARFIGANHRHRPHRLTSMQLSYKVVALQHPAHVQCQTQGYGHGKSFGNGHHDERDSHHEILQHHLGHLEIIRALPYSVVDKDVVYEEDDESSDSHHRANHRDEFSQFAQLDVQWRLDVRCFARLAGYPTNLRSVANRRDNSRSAPIHDLRAAQDHVMRICFLMRFITPVIIHANVLWADRLARQRRLVYQQTNGLDELSVSRNLISHFNHHQVAHHHVLSGNLSDAPIAPNLHQRLFIQRIENVEFPGSVAFKIKAYAGRKENGDKDTNGFYKVTFNESQRQRECGSHQKHLNDGVAILVQIQFPQ